MSFLRKLIGGGVTTPDELHDVQAVCAALSAAARERETIEAERRDLIERRHAALAADESDSAIKRIDTTLDTLSLSEDRLDALLPRLHRRMGELQSADRQNTLSMLKGEYNIIVNDLDAAIAAVLLPLSKFHVIVGQIDAAGFSVEARHFVIPPPLVGEGVLASPETLELWRRERERVADMMATAARGLPLHAPRTEAPKPAPVAPPAPVIMQPRPRRAPIKVAGSPAYGFTKIVLMRNGVEIDGVARIAGDEIILPSSKAEQIVRNGAADIVEFGKAESEAAE